MTGEASQGISSHVIELVTPGYSNLRNLKKISDYELDTIVTAILFLGIDVFLLQVFSMLIHELIRWLLEDIV